MCLATASPSTSASDSADDDILSLSARSAEDDKGGLIGPENIQPLVSIQLKIFLAKLDPTVPLVNP
ncbi:hypothetical protein E2C01_095355 [Portunus trituberculatus]|uniref:Uncharacterized protein n=1 Tax=Portunus trituberculatus TaxID=210409 RepID=A0A5B7JYH9_PORTR|nr:hypothetical protein [Portunus trituberculatus]